MRKIWAIASVTLKEGLRDRIMWVALLFSLLLILSTTYIIDFSVTQMMKVAMEVGSAMLALGGLVIATILGIGIISRELERRTVYAIFARPVTRAQYVAGRFCGLLLTMLITLAAMALLLFGVAAWIKRMVPGETIPPLPVVMWHVFLELMLVTALAVLLSTIWPPIPALMGILAVYVSGHLVGYAKEALAGAGGAAYLPWAILQLWPDLEYLNLKGRVMALIDQPIGAWEVVWHTLYAGAYAGVFLLLAAALLRRRELP